MGRSDADFRRRQADEEIVRGGVVAFLVFERRKQKTKKTPMIGSRFFRPETAHFILSRIVFERINKCFLRLFGNLLPILGFIEDVERLQLHIEGRDTSHQNSHTSFLGKKQVE
jgi:hypothetical protein